MVVGLLVFGITSGLLGAVMAWAATGWFLAALAAYAIFGSLGATLFAAAAAARGSSSRAAAETGTAG